MASGRLWTAAECATLDRLRAAKTPVQAIATALGRSVRAVYDKIHQQTPAMAARRCAKAKRYSSLAVPKDDPGILGEGAFADDFDETERRWREAYARHHRSSDASAA